MRNLFLILSLAALTACGADGAPTAPTSPNTTPAPGLTITGEASIGMKGSL